MNIARKRVFSTLKKVPRGMVVSYGELARIAKTSPRAVGMFMKTNTDPKTIPCYKVIRSDGRLGGYSRGLKRKIALLKKDGIKIESRRGTRHISKKYMFKFKK